ncbi:MAG TPA: hypothetical protein VMV92_02600 [Streptosporangiaceae bacterium]|nr:hypothetical protein [Streptosporangiaceae bacterium]
MSGTPQRFREARKEPRGSVLDANEVRLKTTHSEPSGIAESAARARTGNEAQSRGKTRRLRALD